VANQIDPAMGAFEENLASLKERIDAPLLCVLPPMTAAEKTMVVKWFI